MLIVEPTLLGLAPEVGRGTPVTGVTTGLLGSEFGDADLLSPGEAFLAMGAWILTLFAEAARILRRRDLT
jgi:hypothetical protein